MSLLLRVASSLFSAGCRGEMELVRERSGEVMELGGSARVLMVSESESGRMVGKSGVVMAVAIS